MLSTPESSSAPLACFCFCALRLRLKQAWSHFWAQKKAPSTMLGAFWGWRGPKRIRTAVAAFAELSLATRPSDPFQSGEPPWACEYTKVGSLRFHFWGINSGKTRITLGMKGCWDGLDLRHEHVEMGAQCIDPWQLAGRGRGVLGGGVGIVFGRGLGGRLDRPNGVVEARTLADGCRVPWVADGGGGVGAGDVVRCAGRMGGAEAGRGRADGRAAGQFGGRGDGGRGTGDGGYAACFRTMEVRG